MPNTFNAKLDLYAELAARIWLNVQPGQRVLVVAPIGAAPLVRLFAKHAYQIGSPYVDALWQDEQLVKTRFEFAPRDSSRELSGWLLQAYETAVERGDAFFSVSGQDPDLLKGLDSAFVADAQRTMSEKSRPVTQLLMRNAVNWLGVGMPVPAWAARVFPGKPEHEQVEMLWETIFHVCRINEADPIKAWQAHAEELTARCAYLNVKRYSALHFVGPETDLKVHLPRGHHWIGAGEKSAAGVLFYPNVPTEEVFTVPHRDCVDGYVTSTKPRDVRGVVIEKFTLWFENGRVVKARASNGQDVVETLLATDEAASRLGEVALVPHNSPISQLGLNLYNALYDENAASHLALGSAYPHNLEGGQEMSAQALAANGVNDSLIHFDFMIGSGDIHVDGLFADGSREPVMRAGEWAFRARQ